MYVCMNVCMYVCMCVYIYIYIYTCIHTYTHIRPGGVRWGHAAEMGCRIGNPANWRLVLRPDRDAGRQARAICAEKARHSPPALHL